MSDKLIKSGTQRDRRVRKMGGKITNNGTAAIASGSGFTILRNGTGDVTITLSRAARTFLNAQAIVIQATGATGHFVKLLSATAAAVRVGTYVADGVDGAPADVDFCFEITVKDV